MRNADRIRVVSVIAFLLLLAPFYDQCRSNRMKRDAEGTEVVAVVDSLTAGAPEIGNAEAVSKDTVSEAVEMEKTSFLQKAYDFVDDSDNENAFELALMGSVYLEPDYLTNIRRVYKEEQEGDTGGNPLNAFVLPLRELCILIVILITVVQLVLSFAKRNNWVYKLSIVNLTLMATSLILIFLFDDFFENFSQIKWGCYLFIVSQITLLKLSKNEILSQLKD